MTTVCSALGALAVVSAGLAPNAAAYDVQSKQWYLSVMKADQMWKTSTGKGVKVAVVDTGVNPATPSLKGQVLADEVPEAVAYHATEDYGAHGTTMAEVIAGTGAGGGMKGLAPETKIVPYRIVLEGVPEAERKRTAEAADAVRAAADTDVKIISMSFTGDYIDPELEKSLKYAHSKGKLLFAGVGNDGETKNDIGYPAGYPYVVGVAAADKSGRVGSFSEHGNYVDLAAPGLGIPRWCDTTFRSYCDDGDGTSLATAVASASAALIWSVHPDWTANQVLNVLLDTAGRDWPKDTPSNYLGYGLVRPRVALADKDIDPGAADKDPLSYENGTGVIEESPSASVSASSQPSKNTSGSKASAAESNSEPSEGNTLWVVLGIVAVAVIGGGGYAAMRARRSG